MAISYRSMVRWIADNDEPTLTSAEEIAEQVTVCMIADLLEIDPIEVAHAILRRRRKNERHKENERQQALAKESEKSQNQ